MGTFVADPGVVVAEQAFPFHAVFFCSDLLCLGVGVMPGASYESLGFVVAGHIQCDRSVLEGVTPSVLSHDLWHASQPILTPKPVRHTPENFCPYSTKYHGGTVGTAVIFAPSPDDSVDGDNFCLG